MRKTAIGIRNSLRFWLWSIMATLLIAMIAFCAFIFNKQNMVIAKEREKRFATESLLDKRQYQLDFALNKLEYTASARGKKEDALSSIQKEKRSLERQLQIYAERLHKGEPEVIIFTNSELPADRSPESLAREVMGRDNPLDGKIIGVNEECSKVILNLGKQSGAKLGDALSIYRDNRFIGSVKVVEIESSTCIANVLPRWRGVKFRENDQVER